MKKWEWTLSIKEICEKKGYYDMSGNWTEYSWRVRTDLDEIYKAYASLRLDNDIYNSDFLTSAREDVWNHDYTFFPLTLTHPNHHWILFIIGDDKAYFVSSSTSHSTRLEEKNKIKLLVDGICEQDNTVIYDIIPSSVQLNEYDCGVYLVKYIEHLMDEEEIRDTSLQNVKITQQDIIDFRKKWKEDIGEDLWGEKTSDSKLEETEPDKRWLTDDNIEYILKNYEVDE